MGGLYIREGVQLVLMPVDVVLIGYTPQHVVDDHGDLRAGDALVGTEAAVSPGNPTVAGGLGHIVVEPVTGGHIPEVTVEIFRLVGKGQGDNAEFCPGDGGVRTEGPVGIAIDHTQRGQGVYSFRIPRIRGHIGEADRVRHILVQQQCVEHLSCLRTGHILARAKRAIRIAGHILNMVFGIQITVGAAVTGICGSAGKDGFDLMVLIYILKGVQSEIDGIYQQEDERTRLRDINARRGKVIGRISLWIESVENDTESDKQEQIIKSIEDRIQEIDEILDADSVEDRKQSALSRIQENMTKWAKELELEHCDSPYRLDLNKVTVVVDKPDRPVPLKQLGSGSNWVGVHLIAYFALQYYFIGTNRPVPSFLFFDQPSQVYFPSELDEKNIDWNEVNKMYRFIVDRTSELEGKLQVIIVDHADLNNASFREYICENWWPIDKNLVPNDWYEKD